jgi:Uma2 family endonuclease
MTAPALLTADDLMRLQPPDKHTELVRGHMIVREPPGFRRGDIAVNLAVAIPDLAIEVLSPDDRPGELLEKVADYLNAGTPLVWVVDPDRRQARVHRADGTISTVGESEMLDGEEVIPGFTCLLADVL